MADAQEVIALHLKAHPWLNAEPGTIWSITGAVGEHHTFRDCLAIVLPASVTGGSTLFAMLPPLDYVVPPGQIAHAIEYRLVPETHDSGSS